MSDLGMFDPSGWGTADALDPPDDEEWQEMKERNEDLHIELEARKMQVMMLQTELEAQTAQVLSLRHELEASAGTLQGLRHTAALQQSRRVLGRLSRAETRFAVEVWREHVEFHARTVQVTELHNLWGDLAYHGTTNLQTAALQQLRQCAWRNMRRKTRVNIHKWRTATLKDAIGSTNESVSRQRLIGAARLNAALVWHRTSMATEEIAIHLAAWHLSAKIHIHERVVRMQIELRTALETQLGGHSYGAKLVWKTIQRLRTWNTWVYILSWKQKVLEAKAMQRHDQKIIQLEMSKAID